MFLYKVGCTFYVCSSWGGSTADFHSTLAQLFGLSCGSSSLLFALVSRVPSKVSCSVDLFPEIRWNWNYGILAWLLIRIELWLVVWGSYWFFLWLCLIFFWWSWSLRRSRSYFFCFGTTNLIEDFIYGSLSSLMWLRWRDLWWILECLSYDRFHMIRVTWEWIYRVLVWCWWLGYWLTWEF